VGVPTKIFIQVFTFKCHRNLSIGRLADTCRKTDGRVVLKTMWKRLISMGKEYNFKQMCYMRCKKFSLLVHSNHGVNFISACLPVNMTESEQQV